MSTPPGSSGAQRQRRYRQRVKDGRSIYRVETDEPIFDALELAGLLTLHEASDRTAVERALTLALAQWASVNLRDV